MSGAIASKEGQATKDCKDEVFALEWSCAQVQLQAADGRPVCLRTRVWTCWPVGTGQETFQLESDRLTEKVRLLHPFGRMLDAGRPGRVRSTASTQDASSYFDVKRCDREIILGVSSGKSVTQEEQLAGCFGGDSS